jgi:hypothetical protein
VQGAIIGKTNLVKIFTTESIRDTLSAEERAFGDYRDKRFAWQCEGATLLPNPIKVHGKLSIWDYDMDVTRELEEFDPDYIGPDRYKGDPDMMGENAAEFAERMAGYQRLK